MSPDAAIGLWASFALYGFTPNVFHRTQKEPLVPWDGDPLEEEPAPPLDQSAVAFLAVEAALNQMEAKFPRRILRRALILMYHDQLPVNGMRRIA